MKELPKFQKEDAYFGAICKYHTDEIQNPTPELIRRAKAFTINQNLLFRVHKFSNLERFIICIPFTLRDQVFQQLDRPLHQAYHKTFALCVSRIYVPNLRKFVQECF